MPPENHYYAQGYMLMARRGAGITKCKLNYAGPRLSCGAAAYRQAPIPWEDSRGKKGFDPQNHYAPVYTCCLISFFCVEEFFFGGGKRRSRIRNARGANVGWALAARKGIPVGPASGTALVVLMIPTAAERLTAKNPAQGPSAITSGSRNTYPTTWTDSGPVVYPAPAPYELEWATGGRVVAFREYTVFFKGIDNFTICFDWRRLIFWKRGTGIAGKTDDLKIPPGRAGRNGQLLKTWGSLLNEFLNHKEVVQNERNLGQRDRKRKNALQRTKESHWLGLRAEKKLRWRGSVLMPERGERDRRSRAPARWTIEELRADPPTEAGRKRRNKPRPCEGAYGTGASPSFSTRECSQQPEGAAFAFGWHRGK